MASILEKKMTMWALKGIRTQSYNIRNEHCTDFPDRIETLTHVELFDSLFNDKIGFMIYTQVDGRPKKFIYGDTYFVGRPYKLGASATEFYKHMESAA